MPYLLLAGKKASEEAGKKLGVGAWDKAKQIWGRLGGAVDKEPMAAGAAQEAAAHPEDADAQAALRLQLRKILEQDEALAGEVSTLLADGRQAAWHAEVHGDGAVAQGPGAVAAGKGGVAVGGDVQGDVVVGTDSRTVSGGD